MKHLLNLVLAVSVLTWAHARADAGNWERFRGPNGFGVAEDKDIPVHFGDKENILWKMPLPGLGNSSPIVWGKYLFLQTSSADGKQRLLLCIDAVHGKQLWSRGIPAAQGAKIDKHPKNTLASSTPVTDGESIFVSFWDGKNVFLAAYNFKGDLIWNKPLGRWVSQHGTGASPILYKDKVIFCNDMDKESQKKEPVPNPSILYAFNKKTGDSAWELPREAYRACYSAPFLLEKLGSPTELIVTSTTSITSYNPDDGSENWRWNWTFKGMHLRTVACSYFADGMLFAGSGDGGGERQFCAIALHGAGKNARPAQLWQNFKDFPYVPCILTQGDFLYFVNDGGYAGCFEAKTGKKVWYERFQDHSFTSSPVLIGDKIYAPSEEGNVHVFTATPAGFQPIAANYLGETLRASPAVADGRLYIRGQHHLFCIGNKR
jgi:outer membrane protein assembly factor BamB